MNPSLLLVIPFRRRISGSVSMSPHHLLEHLICEKLAATPELEEHQIRGMTIANGIGIQIYTGGGFKLEISDVVNHILELDLNNQPIIKAQLQVIEVEIRERLYLAGIDFDSLAVADLKSATLEVKKISKEEILWGDILHGKQAITHLTGGETPEESRFNSSIFSVSHSLQLHERLDLKQMGLFLSRCLASKTTVKKTPYKESKQLFRVVHNEYVLDQNETQSLLSALNSLDRPNGALHRLSSEHGLAYTLWPESRVVNNSVRLGLLSFSTSKKARMLYQIMTQKLKQTTGLDLKLLNMREDTYVRQI